MYTCRVSHCLKKILTARTAHGQTHSCSTKLSAIEHINIMRLCSACNMLHSTWPIYHLALLEIFTNTWYMCKKRVWAIIHCPITLGLCTITCWSACIYIHISFVCVDHIWILCVWSSSKVTTGIRVSYLGNLATRECGKVIANITDCSVLLDNSCKIRTRNKARLNIPSFRW